MSFSSTYRRGVKKVSHSILKLALPASSRERLAAFWRLDADALQRAVNTISASNVTDSMDINRRLQLLATELQANQQNVANLIKYTAATSAESIERDRNLALQIDASREATADKIRSLSSVIVALGSQIDDAFYGIRRSVAKPADVNVATDLYLSLLEKQLTGSLQKDAAMSLAGQTSPYDPAVRSVGRDWPSQAYTMIGLSRLRNIRFLLGKAFDEKVPGDFIETGVWRGGACIYARAVMMARNESERKVFVADSFEGLPPPNEDDYPADMADPHHTFEELRVSQTEVENNFAKFGLLDDNVVFLKGWFKDTLPSAPIKQIAVLRLDGDMYESTIQALDALYDKVSPGGYVIIDDYILENCAKAVNDFRTSRGISAPLIDVDEAAVWWQVPQRDVG